MKRWFTEAPPDALPRVRGSFYTVSTKYGTHIQTWPKKGKRKVTWAVNWYRQQFAAAAHMTTYCIDLDVMTAHYVAQFAEEVPRDILTRAMYGRAYEIVSPDGTVWGVDPHAPPPEIEPIPPIEDDSMWYWGSFDEVASGSLSSTASSTKGMRLTSVDAIPIKAFRAWLPSPEAGHIYRLTVATRVGSNNIGEILGTYDFEWPAAEPNCWDIPLEIIIPAATNFYLLLTDTNLDGTTSLPMRVFSQRWQYPIAASAFVHAQTNDPQPGQTMSQTTSGGTGIGFQA